MGIPAGALCSPPAIGYNRKNKGHVVKSRKRVIVSAGLFLTVCAVGVAGFKILGGESWSLLDAAYMTVITVATVGYGEVHDLAGNSGARLFTLVYIILSLGTIAFAVTSITAFIVEGELKSLLGRKRMDKDIGRISGHIIVCGSDETAETVIRELRATGRDFVVVDASAERMEKLMESGRFLHIVGDPADDDVLLQSGIEKARGIILSLPTDEANLFAAVSARSLNPRLRIIAKGIDVRSHGKIRKAGADYVVSPAYIGGMRMVSQMVRPAVVSFLDKMLYGKDQVLRVEESVIREDSPIAGRTLADSGLKTVPGALLVSMRKADTDDFRFQPADDTRLGPGDVLVFIATAEGLSAVRKTAGPS